ncbi:HD domain-containing protein [Falcatimonas sp. MSJ-15]|uniref:HD domain-containing phosphohydrolase n=1 Tax=Falcatimonas sp. MSJ-15 TaxID=2841515 RepID=UPI001C1044A7|nr:HD domain-containing phosphohydrolase [Falcatimonas sp. MSJ-15]MBU5469632.1 HD domain-containing protein [Falcatimonas sp. MSJ-15]
MIAFCQIVQMIGLFVIINTMVYVGTRRVSKEGIIIEISLFAVLVSSVAYLIQTDAKNYNEAVACLKMVYLGKAYIGFVYFMFYFVYMKKKLKRPILYLLCAFHTFIYALVLAGDKIPLFFKGISYYENYKGYMYLEVKNGIFYYIHIFVALVYSIIMFYNGIKYYHEHKTDPDSKIMLGMIYAGAISIIGVMIHLTGADYEYDVTTMMLEIGTVIFAIATIKNRAFETVEIAKDNVIENLSDGIIVLNSDFDILYFNNEAQKIFPKVSNIESNDVGIIKQFCEFMETSYDRNGRYYDVQINDLTNNDIVTGYTVSLVDITTHMEYSKMLENEVAEKAKKISKIQERFIVSFANMIELRDDITGQHVKRTSRYVRIIANALKKRNIYPGIITDEFVDAICKAAPLHDIGKIAISDSILRKPGKLTEEEFEIIKTHPKVGGDMLREALKIDEADEYLTYAYEMAMYHHEKWNGTGYPEGLKGNEIPLSARIMAIADVFDALTSKRSYKDKISDDRAFEIIEQSSGSHFDPILVNVFVDIKEEILETKNKNYE